MKQIKRVEKQMESYEEVSCRFKGKEVFYAQISLSFSSLFPVVFRKINKNDWFILERSLILRIGKSDKFLDLRKVSEEQIDDLFHRICNGESIKPVDKL